MSSSSPDDQIRDDSGIDPSNWISQAEAARSRGVSRQAIHDLVKRERLRVLKMGGRTLVHKDDVEEFEPQEGGRPPKLKEEDEDQGSNS
ncbi:helix-turn-helix domain-containing protein [Salinibacter ruber]|uniref:helix-turn-helix domain-containing protein n=1 Tax=Salinibacter ruber TaxID=146919 RepID=UPI003C6E8D29